MKTFLLAALLLVTVVTAAPNGQSRSVKSVRPSIERINGVTSGNRKRAAPVIPRLPPGGEDECDNVNGVCKPICSPTEEAYPESVCPGGQECCQDDGGVIGDPHFSSLDGKHYTNQGKCRYVLLKDCVAKPHWIITVGNEEGWFKGHGVTRVKQVTVRVGGHTVTFGPKHESTVNGNAIKGPLRKVDLGAKDLSVTKEGGMMEFEYYDHFKVSFDGVHHVDVEVSPKLEGKVCGMLGNNDNNPRNDFTMPDGTITKDADKFAESWKVPNSCSDQ
ncbi:BMP-binding endothelial regulator protein-like [Ptychodera flava]|uniref:BMP-binding endothelial regulator protein-like n=1 Tax=Ptychodera flava TaxID=63121 RepID=UPI003969D47F